MKRTRRKKAVARFTGSYRNQNQALQDWEARRDEAQEEAGLVTYTSASITPPEIVPASTPLVKAARQGSLF